MKGWIRIERKVFSDDFFAREPMSEREAWMWMIANAAWEDTAHTVGGERHPVPRGSFMVTLREMQSAFGWRSDTKVRNFLKRLELERMVKRTTCGPRNASKTHVTICKYDEYQSQERTRNAPETHEKRTSERSKETNINNKQSSSNEEIQQAYDGFKTSAANAGWPVPRSFSQDRKAALRKRLAELGGLDGWAQALRRAEASDFLCQSTWFGFDWMLSPKNLRKIMEGNYDNRTRPTSQPSNGRAGSAHDCLMAGFSQFANSEPAASGSDFDAGETTIDASYETMDLWQSGDASQPVLRVIGSD